MNPEYLHIGTSGWSYRHWDEIFYPKDTRPEKYLEHYITKFSCVELNSCFYHLPRKATVTGWMNRTPENFRFCLKLSRLITHQLKLENIEIPLFRFFNVFEGMRTRLGPVLIQLPPGLHYDKNLICNFFDILKNIYNQCRFAVEVRHHSWINDEFFDILARYRIGYVIADSGKRYPSHETVTTDFVYLRFHGREQLYASDYSENILEEYAEKIKGWLSSGKEVWSFFNNDYHGFAPKNAALLHAKIFS
jgi:uncharacterized protein YecE (DUF72 family)